MSTITKRLIWAAPLVLVAWIALMAGIMRVSDAAPAAVVPFPSEKLLASLPDDTGILSLGRSALIVANRPEMTRALYEAGALLVLPAGLTGCIPLTKELRAKLVS
ncbi:MAG: hypothetical protein HKN27_15360 [Silicimonas sp.]|nr:hypothetical protein [Silicimonas sp.]